jgi:acetyltransferase-like isoleucine patch superfamily enzyme
MSEQDGVVRIARQTPQSRAMAEDAKRAMRMTAVINRLTFDDVEKVRKLFGELTGRDIDERFCLIPPFWTACGKEIHVGANVFINQNCTIYDLAPVVIGDDVMIGPNVSLITSGHPLAPSQRRSGVTAKPITIGKGVWIAAGVTIIGGVTVGENTVVAAGSVVTRNAPANCLVGGNPAKVIRPLDD